MMLGSLVFHHIGLATRSLTSSAAFLAAAGYQLSEPVFDPEQSVNLVFAKHAAMPAVELVSPERGLAGPVDGILKTATTAIYHLGYGCERIEDALDELKTAGFRALPVSPPKPAVLFGGSRVGFYLVKDFGLVELIEEPVSQR
jgi:methylmalonyl-CoA/ethylmalonyl-CoA epimerase